MTEKGAEQQAKVERRSAMRDVANIGAGILLFVLGLVAGFPLATSGTGYIADNLGQIFSVVLTLLIVFLFIAAVIFIFRRQIWESLFRRGEIEIERFALPLADVARYAARQQVEQATDAARNLAELVLARYAWVATRRWMVATITAFIAAIAALAGSALLFQQNQLLREQTARLSEQNEMIEYQIELGEAARSASILPEILDIGAELGRESETAALLDDGSISTQALSQSLQARIVAATNAARPYRYLRSPLTDLDPELTSIVALLRREDLPGAAYVAGQLAEQGIDKNNVLMGGSGALTDRPVSPERGQILALLYQLRVFDTQWLTGLGADFSYAEVRVPIFGLMSLRHANLRFADFSRIAINQVDFGAANLEEARFVRAEIVRSKFAAVPANDSSGPFTGPPDLIWPTPISGADFQRARIIETSFAGANGLAINFDDALLHEVDFTGAGLGGSTFRNAVFGTVGFTGADVMSVDFTGAVVFDPAFLTNLAANAAPETFNAAEFELVPLTDEERDMHPLNIEYFRLGDLATQPAFRVIKTSLGGSSGQ